MTVCMVISLLIIPYIHRIYVYTYGSGQPYVCVIFGTGLLTSDINLNMLADTPKENLTRTFENINTFF
jgi:hypothetical protein